MNGNQQQKTNTSTQVRTIYSDSMSYITIKFYNMLLSFNFVPFASKDANGRSTFNTEQGVLTTVNLEGAYALYKTAMDIIDGKVSATSCVVQCNQGITLTLDHSDVSNTTFTVNKNGQLIPFRFATQNRQDKDDSGNMVTRTIQTGLGAFASTLKGYLEGVNADRHLNKLTEDFAKTQGGQNAGQGNHQSSGTWQGGNNQRGNYQNRGNYNRNNNRQSYPRNSYGGYNNQQQGQQPMSSYQPPGQ